MFRPPSSCDALKESVWKRPLPQKGQGGPSPCSLGVPSRLKILKSMPMSYSSRNSPSPLSISARTTPTDLRAGGLHDFSYQDRTRTCYPYHRAEGSSIRTSATTWFSRLSPQALVVAGTCSHPLSTPQRGCAPSPYNRTAAQEDYRYPSFQHRKVLPPPSPFNTTQGGVSTSVLQY